MGVRIKNRGAAPPCMGPSHLSTPVAVVSPEPALSPSPPPPPTPAAPTPMTAAQVPTGPHLSSGQLWIPTNCNTSAQAAAAESLATAAIPRREPVLARPWRARCHLYSGVEGGSRSPVPSQAQNHPRPWQLGVLPPSPYPASPIVAWLDHSAQSLSFPIPQFPGGHTIASFTGLV